MSVHRSDGPNASVDFATEVGATSADAGPAAPWPPGPGAVLAERYQVDAVIGRGGSGVVLRGHDLVTGAEVAIKAVGSRSPALEAAAQRESQILARLDHPGVVRHFAHGRVDGGGTFLVLELLVGETLRERLHVGPLTPGEACGLAARVLRALAHAHARGVVHRDVKPANVFLVDRALARPKLIDFGVAITGDDLLARGTGIAGTPIYMAPEQARGDADLDGRVDVFSVGCLLVECLCGRPLFQGAGLAPFAKLALSDRIAEEGALDDVPGPIAAIATRMLASDRARRPADAAALADELDGCAVGLSELVVPSEKNSARMGTREARPLVVLLLGPATRDLRDAAEQAVLDAARSWGGEAQRLPSSASLVTFGVGAGARDQAIRAAHAALALRRRFPSRAIAITFSRATMDRRALVGPALDEGSRILQGGQAGEARVSPISIDAEIAALLSGRFAIASGAAGQTLDGELAGADAPRSLLGRQVPFEGRERELGALLSTVTRTFESGRASLAIVTAPAGGGKSRLRQELVLRLGAEAAGARMLMGIGDALRAGTPYALLSSAVRAFAGLDRRASSPKSRSAEARKVAALVDGAAPWLPDVERRRLVAFVGELADVRLSDRGDLALRAARRDGRLMADQIRIAFVDWLGHLLARGPVVLVLDDLHWGDAPSFHLVGSALREHAHRPLVVLGFGRPELDERYPNLWAELGPVRVALEPLADAAARRLARKVVPELGDDQREALVARASGNPFFLEELLRHAVERGGSSDDDAVNAPATVLAAVQARLDRVGEGGRRVLRAASVFGETFTSAGLGALLDEPAKRDLGAWLEELARRDLVANERRAHRKGRDRWGFRHALVRDAAYDTLTDVDRRVGHRLAAGYLEGEGERGLVLATHLERAGEPERARHHFRLAAEDAVRANDFDGAIAQCRRAERLGATGAELGLVRLAEARAHVWRSDWTEVLRSARDAEGLLDGDESFAATEHVLIALGNLGRMDQYLAGHRALFARRPEPEPSVAWMNAVFRSAGSACDSGEIEYVERVLSSVGDAGRVPEVMGFREHTAARLLMTRGQMAESAAALGRAQEAFDAAGDIREGCSNLNNLLAVLLELGRTSEAVRRGTELVRLCRLIDHRFILKFALLNLAVAYQIRGELEAARTAIEEGKALACEAQEPRVEGFALLLLAQSALAQGRAASAVANAREASARFSDTRALAFVADAALSRGLLSLGGGAEEAIPLARGALATFRELGGATHGELTVWLAAVEAERAAGSVEAARALTSQALMALERRLRSLDEVDRRTLLRSPLEVTPLLQHAHELDLALPTSTRNATPEPPDTPG